MANLKPINIKNIAWVLAIAITALVTFSLCHIMYSAELMEVKEDYWRLVTELNHTKALLSSYRDRYIIMEKMYRELEKSYNVTKQQLKEIETELKEYNSTVCSVVKELNLRQKVQSDFIELITVAVLAPEAKDKLVSIFLEMERDVKSTGDEDLVKLWEFAKKELMEKDYRGWMECLFKLVSMNQYKIEKLLKSLPPRIERSRE
ncbi:MAG: hypothetical protein DRJ40_00750 [Thermoprotei archaeon]|nr:MAG: hypothetical protein DRJ40_00750 [Thermoprotei archaeon]